MDLELQILPEAIRKRILGSELRGLGFRMNLFPEPQFAGAVSGPLEKNPYRIP